MTKIPLQVFEVANMLFDSEETAYRAIEVTVSNLPPAKKEAQRTALRREVTKKYLYFHGEHL